ncbi:MAG: phosphotransferase [Bacteroidota bacterium]
MKQPLSLPSFIEQHYPLEEVRIASVLQEKGGRSVLLIHSKQGAFVYKESNAAKTQEEMAREMFVFDFAEQHDFLHLPKLLKTRRGESFVKREQGYIHLMSFLEGGMPENDAPTWARIGALTAALHALPDYPYQTAFSPASEVHTHEAVARDLPFGQEYLAIANRLPDFSQCSRSLIHTDIGRHNMAQDQAGKLYFLDWDGVGVGIRILDVGFPLLSQFLGADLKFRAKHAAAFYHAYFQHRTLPATDKDLIFDAALFFQLIYLPYGEIDKNWQKIQFALEKKEEIIAVIPL